MGGWQPSGLSWALTRRVGPSLRTKAQRATQAGNTRIRVLGEATGEVTKASEPLMVQAAQYTAAHRIVSRGIRRGVKLCSGQASFAHAGNQSRAARYEHNTVRTKP